MITECLKQLNAVQEEDNKRELHTVSDLITTQMQDMKRDIAKVSQSLQTIVHEIICKEEVVEESKEQDNPHTNSFAMSLFITTMALVALSFQFMSGNHLDAFYH
jgi:copper chaperone CopZ